jgi:hypothetical protein
VSVPAPHQGFRATEGSNPFLSGPSLFAQRNAWTLYVSPKVGCLASLILVAAVSCG